MTRGRRSRPRRTDCAPAEHTGVQIRVVTPNNWEHVMALFGKKGACGGCWCMWWRVPRGGKTWEAVRGEGNRERLRQLVEDDQLHAILAFSGPEPVGWCSFGPRQTFPRLETVRALREPWTERTWSVVCFYIAPAWRGRGVATRLLEAATAHALSLGADRVEGYPVVPKQTSAPVPAAFAWTGVPAMFRVAGYEEVPRPAGLRPIFVAPKTTD